MTAFRGRWERCCWYITSSSPAFTTTWLYETLADEEEDQLGLHANGYHNWKSGWHLRNIYSQFKLIGTVVRRRVLDKNGFLTAWRAGSFAKFWEMQDVCGPCQFCQLCSDAPVNRVSSNTALMQAVVCKVCSSGTSPNVLTSSSYRIVSIRGIIWKAHAEIAKRKCETSRMPANSPAFNRS